MTITIPPFMVFLLPYLAVGLFYAGRISLEAQLRVPENPRWYNWSVVALWGIAWLPLQAINQIRFLRDERRER